MTPFGKHEHVLNYTANRYHLLRPKSVGPTSELIRECEPFTVQEWEEFYWENAHTKTKAPFKITEEYIDEIGERLYVKMVEFVAPEFMSSFEEITVEECKQYIKDVTIRRSYEGYHSESVVYRVLSNEFDGSIRFVETDSVTDSAMGVDYEGLVEGSHKRIGLQVKPISSKKRSQGLTYTEWSEKAFKKYEEKYGGKVFVVLTKKEGKKHVIVNTEIIGQIQDWLQLHV